MNGSAGTCSLCCFQILSGSVDLDALKIPAPKGGILTNGGSALSPFQAEPIQREPSVVEGGTDLFLAERVAHKRDKKVQNGSIMQIRTYNYIRQLLH
jgi:hypothetical protein